MGKGSRWPDKEDDYSGDPEPRANPRKPAPRISKPKSRQAPRPERTEHKDYGEMPLRNMRKVIIELVDADPQRKVQSITDELEEMGYDTHAGTVSAIRAEHLDIYKFMRPNVPPIIKRTAAPARPTPNKRIPPARR